MRAEADQAHDRDRQQRGARAQRHAQALTRAWRGEHQEGKHQARGDLDAHARRQRARGRARAPARPRGQSERQRQRQQQQRVVVRSAHRQHQQHGVQAHERQRPARGVTETPGRARDQRDRAEAREDRDRLERPQPAREAQWNQRVAHEREQRAVGRVLKRPPDEAGHRVRGGFGGKVRVRIQSVQDPQPREGQVAEHVLGDQRRPEQQDRVRRHDRAREHRQRQPACDQQHQRVARAHDQHQRLEAGAGEADVQAPQRTGQPGGPAAFAGGDVLPGRGGGAGAHQEHARHDAQQPERAERSREASGYPSARRRAGVRGRRPGDPNGI